MKKRLNEDVLSPGDIILTTSDALVSRKIGKYTSSDVSHAMLYVTHCSVIHAVGYGVHAENTQRLLFEDEWPVHVLRLKGGLPKASALRICDFVREIVGTEYSYIEAGKALSAKWVKASPKQFCSRLVAQAYLNQGYELVPNPNFCAPGAFKKSDLLEIVDNATVPVSHHEAAFIESIPNTPDLLRDATNALFSGVRKIDRKVQNFSQVGQLVIRHLEHDSAVRDIIVASGYLNYWDTDMKEHPWRYDINQLEQLPPAVQVEAYCVDTMKAEPRDNNRFTKTLSGLMLDNRFTPRATLAVLIDLYEKLVALHARRIDTATTWLERHASVAG